MKLPSRITFTIFTLFVLVLTIGCNSQLFGGGAAEIVPVVGDVTRLEGRATLSCTQTCRDQAQCGNASQLGTDVIMLREDAPDLEGHSFIIVNGFQANIIGYQPLRLSPALDTTQFLEVNFYQVEVEDQNRTRTGWVAGWCIQQP